LILIARVRYRCLSWYFTPSVQTFTKRRTSELFPTADSPSLC
jgi:hypothetical protein